MILFTDRIKDVLYIKVCNRGSGIQKCNLSFQALLLREGYPYQTMQIMTQSIKNSHILVENCQKIVLKRTFKKHKFCRTFMFNEGSSGTLTIHRIDTRIEHVYQLRLQHTVENHCPATYNGVIVILTMLHLGIMYRASLNHLIG